ncbi:MAG: class I SAM-dependent methyltransferase [Ardenticatenaceae bacterium]
MFVPILGYAKELVEGVLSEGDVAIDATVGNGHDTRFLAHCVGAEGRVYGFDIQEAAITMTRERLRQAGVLERVRLFVAGHEQMEELVRQEEHEVGQVKAVMFNLGYLPQSDQSIITRPETTLPALQAALRLLAPGGMITIIVYTGHPGGQQEYEAIMKWVKKLSTYQAKVLSYQFVNPRTPRTRPPSLIAIGKVPSRRKQNQRAPKTQRRKDAKTQRRKDAKICNRVMFREANGVQQASLLVRALRDASRSTTTTLVILSAVRYQRSRYRSQILLSTFSALRGHFGVGSVE